jgi:hypothetical protein
MVTLQRPRRPWPAVGGATQRTRQSNAGARDAQLPWIRAPARHWSSLAAPRTSVRTAHGRSRSSALAPRSTQEPSTGGSHGPLAGARSSAMAAHCPDSASRGGDQLLDGGLFTQYPARPDRLRAADWASGAPAASVRTLPLCPDSSPSASPPTPLRATFRERPKQNRWHENAKFPPPHLRPS